MKPLLGHPPAKRKRRNSHERQPCNPPPETHARAAESAPHHGRLCPPRDHTPGRAGEPDLACCCRSVAVPVTGPVPTTPISSSSCRVLYTVAGDTSGIIDRTRVKVCSAVGCSLSSPSRTRMMTRRWASPGGSGTHFFPWTVYCGHSTPPNGRLLPTGGPEGKRLAIQASKTRAPGLLGRINLHASSFAWGACRPPSSLSSMRSAWRLSPTIVRVSMTCVALSSSSTCSVTNHCNRTWLA
jgi:hypothetical protein